MTRAGGPPPEVGRPAGRPVLCARTIRSSGDNPRRLAKPGLDVETSTATHGDGLRDAPGWARSATRERAGPASSAVFWLLD